mmetsp:Transcript_45552/g.80165  ORF Transcript_45552/g.80165 Transcript_45552/m.80165 type:complete len:269 (+) Transcript_45552:80-886(+)
MLDVFFLSWNLFQGLFEKILEGLIPTLSESEFLVGSHHQGLAQDAHCRGWCLGLFCRLQRQTVFFKLVLQHSKVKFLRDCCLLRELALQTFRLLLPMLDQQFILAKLLFHLLILSALYLDLTFQAPLLLLRLLQLCASLVPVFCRPAHLFRQLENLLIHRFSSQLPSQKFLFLNRKFLAIFQFLNLRTQLFNGASACNLSFFQLVPVRAICKLCVCVSPAYHLQRAHHIASVVTQHIQNFVLLIKGVAFANAHLMIYSVLNVCQTIPK